MRDADKQHQPGAAEAADLRVVDDNPCIQRSLYDCPHGGQRAIMRG